MHRIISTAMETKNKDFGEHEQVCYSYINYYIEDAGI